MLDAHCVLLLKDLEDVDEAGELHRYPGHKVVNQSILKTDENTLSSFLFQQVELKLIISTIIEIHANKLEK